MKYLNFPSKMKVLFIIRKARINARGECPISCRITIDGERSNIFSTGLFVQPKKWNAKLQKSKDQLIDQELDRIRYQLTELYNEERYQGRRVAPNNILDIYRHGRAPAISWEESISSWLNLLRAKKRSIRTIMAYRRHIMRFREFVKITPQEVERQHLNTYYNVILNNGYDRDYCNKTIQAIYGYFRYLLDTGYIQKNPVVGVRLEWENKIDTTCLTEDEIMLLLVTEWSEPIQKTVDAFLFMCYSGMHVGDYLRMAPDWVDTSEEEGRIVYSREKTGKQCEIPINPMLASLMIKYGGVEKLPKQSAQKMNIYLKSVAQTAGIKKLLTNKIARKTFTDMSLNCRNMSEESVAAMLGHSRTSYVRVYGSVRYKRVKSEWVDNDKPTKMLLGGKE